MKVLLDIILRDSTRPVGLGLVLFCVGWAAMLVTPFSSLAASPSMHMLATAAPDWFWAVVFVPAGATEVAALILNRRRPRRWAAFVMAVLWWIIAGAGWTSGALTLAPVSNSILAILASWIYWRLGRQTAGTP